jgi:hypothetical protein
LNYWYSRAGRIRPDIPLEAEWKQLVEEMLAKLVADMTGNRHNQQPA